MQSAITKPSAARAAAAALDDRAAALVAELTSLPAGHPRRPRLREEAILAWLPMARRLVRRYAGHGESTDDLVQAATIGLIKAVDRFDPDQGKDFTGYAIPTILGELKRHFRDRTWAVRVPRRFQEMRIAITRAGNDLQQTLGRSPTIAEVAAHLGVTEEQVIEGLEGARVYQSASLSTPVGGEGSLELGDCLGAEDADYARTDLRLSLEPAMAWLTDRERHIVTAYYYGNQTQAQIAARLGLSQMHVSRLITRAVGKLREQLGPEAA